MDYLPPNHAEQCTENAHIKYGQFIETILAEGTSGPTVESLRTYMKFLGDREQFIRKKDPLMVMLDGEAEEAREAIEWMRQLDSSLPYDKGHMASELGDLAFYTTHLGARMYGKVDPESLAKSISEIPVYVDGSPVESSEDRIIIGALRMEDLYQLAMPSLWEDEEGNKLIWPSNRERCKAATGSYLAVLDDVAREYGTSLPEAMMRNIEKLGLNRTRPAGVIKRPERSWESLIGNLKDLASELSEPRLAAKLTSELDVALNNMPAMDVARAFATLSLGARLTSELTTGR